MCLQSMFIYSDYLFMQVISLYYCCATEAQADTVVPCCDIDPQSAFLYWLLAQVDGHTLILPHSGGASYPQWAPQSLSFQGNRRGWDPRIH